MVRLDSFGLGKTSSVGDWVVEVQGVVVSLSATFTQCLRNDLIMSALFAEMFAGKACSGGGWGLANSKRMIMGWN